MSIADEMVRQIQRLKKEKNAVILAHTYQPGDVQDVADFVGDSYGLSVEANRTDADLVVFCGVLFMAETAAILNPSKTVILPEPEAGCPMADMITARDLEGLKREHPEHTVVSYVNSPAEVKAASSICCTSSNAEKIVERLPHGQGIIFVPDRHLGTFIRERTGREMVLWSGFCPTHVRIKPSAIEAAKAEHPEAIVMIHPEAPKESRDLADQVLSTGQMCTFAKRLSHTEFIVATEVGLIHTLRKQNPDKIFYSISGEITCPDMKLGSLRSTLAALEGQGGLRVTVRPEIAARAEISLRRMLHMSS
jgi:quinolinate synthase